MVLSFAVPPALPCRVLPWGQPGLEPGTRREFGLSPGKAEAAPRGAGGGPLWVTGLQLCARSQPAPWHRGTMAPAAILPGTGDQLVSVPVFTGGFKGSGCPLTPAGGPGW